MSHGNEPLLALTGGFLGAGKTTLLLAAARLLRSRGLRVAILMNDQGGELVDTRLASAGGFESAEVAGGCFCCRFSDFVHSAEALLSTKPDIIFAEPVGSCMDISATVIRRVRQSLAGRVRLAPFTVLVDPQRAAVMLAPEADPDLGYLFRNQLAEADLVYFTKSDLGLPRPELPGGVTGALSAVSGEGVADWLDVLLSGRVPAGAREIDIDYSRYADAEAALGWLNWHAEFDAAQRLSPASVVGPLLDAIDQSLSEARVPIMNLKIFDQTDSGYIRAGLSANGQEPHVEGDLMASATGWHELLVNLRALGAPEVLRSVVDRAASNLPGAVKVLRCDAFRPSPPVKPV